MTRRRRGTQRAFVPAPLKMVGELGGSGAATAGEVEVSGVAAGSLTSLDALGDIGAGMDIAGGSAAAGAGSVTAGAPGASAEVRTAGGLLSAAGT